MKHVGTFGYTRHRTPLTRVLRFSNFGYLPLVPHGS